VKKEIIRFIIYSILFVLLSMAFNAVLYGQTTEGFTDEYEATDEYQIFKFWYDDFKIYINRQDSLTNLRTPVFLGATLEEWPRVLVPVRNKSGGTLNLGDVCIWDTTEIVVCDTAANETARIEIDLSDEGGWHSIIAGAKTGSASDDSLWIYGLDQDGSAQSEILVITDGDADQHTKSAYRWTQIDSVKDSQAATGWTTYRVRGQPFMGVTTSASASTDFAGVFVGSVASAARTATVADNALGYICVYGVTKAYLDAASTNVWVGDLLEMAAGGDLIAGNTFGEVVARSMEFQDSDDALTRVFVLP